MYHWSTSEQRYSDLELRLYHSCGTASDSHRTSPILSPTNLSQGGTSCIAGNRNNPSTTPSSIVNLHFGGRQLENRHNLPVQNFKIQAKIACGVSKYK